MKRKSFIVSLILIFTVGITTLAVGWHKFITASRNPNLIACENHVDSDFDMACDFCGQILPLSNYVEKKEVAIFSEDDSLIKVNGMMPKDTLVSSRVIEKDEAFSLAKEHLKDLKEDDVLLAYDISLNSKDFEYQPEDFGQTVTVNISKLNLDIKDNVALLHIIDNNNYEILPVSDFTNEEIKFRATRFSTYILISVESHTVKFSGDGDFKITKVSGDEITNNSQVASGTNFAFSIVPGVGYGITGVSIKTASGNVIYPSGDSGDSSFVVVGEELGRTCNISSVTEDIEVNVETALIPKIKTDITTAKVKFGDTATFTISADNATTFTWQYRENENDYWHEMSNSIGSSKVSGDTSTFTTTSATDLLSGYDFRCIVGNDVFKDHHGAVSNIAKLIVSYDTTLAYETPIFLTQPVTAKVLVGDKAIYKVKALGNGLTLTWQYRENDSDYWKDVTNSIGTVSTTNIDDTTKESTLTTVETNYAIYKYQFRCLAGNSYYADHSAVKSDIVNIVMTAEEERTVKYFELEYTKQPLSAFKVKHGDIAVIETSAKGTSKYVWQYKSGDFWESVTSDIGTGYDTNTLKIDTSKMTLDLDNLEVTNNLSGYEFRCQIYNSDIEDYKLYSNIVQLVVTQDDITSPEIAKLAPPEAPKDFVATSVDSEESITVTWATIAGMKYELSYIDDNGEKILLSNNAITPYIHSGLEKNKSYEYVIRAYNEAGVYSDYIVTKGSTKYEDIYDIINKDTIKPVIDNINITPNSGKISPNTDVTITFNTTDDNYDYDASLLYPDEIGVLVNGIESTSANKTLSKASIGTSGERFTLKITNVIGNGTLTIKLPKDKVKDKAKNGNDEYIIETGLVVVRSIIEPVTKLNATSGEYQDSIAITWEDTINSDVKYVLEASKGDNNWIVLSTDTAKTYTHSGLAKNMSFEYRVKAVATNGDESAYVYTIGRTEYDPLFGDVMVDTVKPIIDLKEKNPDVKYLGSTQQIEFTFESFDQNYNSNTTTLTEDGFKIIVGGEEKTDVIKALTKESVESGERFKLTLSNVTGNGTLQIMAVGGTIIDCALNPNDETTFTTDITVANANIITDDAPTLTADVHEIIVNCNQLSDIAISNIVYEYRLSGDGDFGVWITKVVSGDDLASAKKEVIKDLSSDTEYEVRTIVTDVANNTKTSKSAFIRTLKIDASKIEIDHTPTYWTSGDVTATITWNDTTYIHQYSKNNVDWVTATGDSTDVVFGSNGILYARYSDGVGHSDPVEHKIENIDKIKPTIGKIETTNEKANTKIIKVSEIADEGGSGIKGYYVSKIADISNVTWTDLNETSFEYTVVENGRYNVWVIDNAGNVSEAKYIEVTNVMTKVSNIVFDTSMEIDVFETKKTNLTFDGDAKNVTYEIANTSIAKITESGEVTGLASGETVIKVTIEDYDGTKYVRECTLKVNAIDPTLEIDKNTLELIYGDKGIINITKYIGGGDLSVTSDDENVATAKLTNREIKVKATGVGSTEITLKSAETPQYKTKELKITITVIKRTINITSWNGDTFTYDGNEKEVTANAENIVAGTDVTLIYENNKKTDAGNYVAKVIGLDGSDSANYELTGTLEHEWKIEKANRTITMPDKIRVIFGTSKVLTFTYTGEDVEAVVQNDMTDIVSATLTDGIMSGDILLDGVAEGTATIKVIVPASANYNQIEATCEVTVELATGDIKPEVDDITFTYGDAPTTINYDYSGNSVEITAISSNETVAKVTIDIANKKLTITPVNKGDATLTIKAAATAQFKESTVQIKVKVNPRPVSLEWSEDTFIYDGKSKEITAEVSKASIVGNDVVTVTSYKGNKQTNAGKYTAEATSLSDSNYTLVNGTEISHDWEIKKADLNLKLIVSDCVYGGDKMTPSVIGNSGNGSVTYYYYKSGDEVNKKNWSDVTSPIYLEIGDYYMFAVVSETANYNSGETSKELFKVIKVEISVKLTKQGEDYHGEWTNQNVLAEITYSDEAEALTDIYYRLEGESNATHQNTINRTSNTITIEFNSNMNTKVYFVGVNVNGNPVTNETLGYEIRIDKNKPTIGSVVVPTGKANTKVITVSNIKDTGGSRIYGYYVSETDDTSSATWTEFSGDSFTYEALENKTYYFYVIDNAGNISDTTANTKATVDGIVDKISDIEHDKDITVIALKTAKPNITYSGEVASIKYEIEDTNIATVDNFGTITGKAFGNTKMKVTFTDYDGTTTEITINVTVIRDTPKLELDQNALEFIYGDSSKEVKYTYNGNGEITVISNNQNVVTATIDTTTNKITVVPHNNGTAVLTVTAAETPQFNEVSQTINVTVNKRVIEVTWSGDTFIYDGTPKTVTAIVNNIVGSDNVTLIYEDNVKTDYGTYIAKIVGVQNDNYTIDGARNLEKEWRIERAERKLIIIPTQITIMYGYEGTITFMYSGDNADANVTSQNENIATIKSCINQKDGGVITVKPEAAGSTKVIIEVPEVGNYKAISGECEVIVVRNNEAGLDIPDYPKEVTYGDPQFEISFTYTGDANVSVTGNDAISAVLSGDKILVTPKKAGSGEITIKAEQNEHYEAIEKKIAIKVKQKVVTLEWSTPNSFVYDNTEKRVTAKVSNNCIIGADVVAVTEYENNAKIEAGKYVAVAKKISDSNYTLEGATNTSYGWEITKAERTIKIDSPVNLVYDKEKIYEISFTYTGETSNTEATLDVNSYIEMVRCLDSQNAATISLKTLASGKTIMTVKVNETNNYKVAEATCEINVLRADAGLVAKNPKVTFVYGDNAVTNEYEYSGDGKVTISSQNSNIATATINEASKTITITPKNAGATKLVLESSKTDQYLAAKVEIEVVVLPRPIKLEWTDANYTYNGTVQTITVSSITNRVNNDIIVLTYSGNKETNAGTYLAEVTGVNNPNYTIASGENLSKVWEIKKADRKINMQDGITLEYGTNGKVEYTYNSYTNGVDDDVVSSISNENPSIATVIKTDKTVGGTLDITPVKQGETKVTLTIEENQNYNAASKECTIIVKRNSTEKITIDSANKNLVYTYGDTDITEIPYTYNGDVPEIIYTITNANVADVTIDSTNKIIKIKPKYVGSAQITIIAEQTDRYEASSVTINVTVNKRVATLNWGQDEFVYDGSLKEIYASVNNIVSGDIVNVLTYKENQKTDAGDYTAEALTLDNPNYMISKDEPTTQHTWEITKAQITPILTMNDYVYGGVKSVPSVTGNSGEGKVTYYYYSGDNENLVADFSNVNSSTYLEPGTYKMYAVIEETKNYFGKTTDTVTFKVEIVNIDVVLTELGEIYDENWTNNDVIATITVPDRVTNMTSVYYKVSGETTLRAFENTTINSNVVTFTFNKDFNQTISFVAVDVGGRPITTESGAHKVKIDKTKPIVGSITTILGKSNSKVLTVSNIRDNDGGSGVYGYYVNTEPNTANATWIQLDESYFTYEVFENATYYVFVIDNAGNISDVTDGSQIEITEIVDKVNNIILQDITVEVFSKVTPILTYSGEPKTIEYKIADETFATINKDTGEITGIASGETTITAILTNYDGTTEEVTAKLTVTPKVPNLELEKAEVTLTYGDEKTEVKYTYDGSGDVTVSSDNQNVAMAIIENCKIIITPVKVGSATLTVTSSATPQYASVSKTINVTVKKRPVILSWSKDEFTYDGTNKEVTATVENVVSGDIVNINYYEDNIKINAGEYEAIALGVDNEYYTIENGTNINHKWKINKAERKIDIPAIVEVVYGEEGLINFTYDGEDSSTIAKIDTTTYADIELENVANGGTIRVTPISAGTAIVTVEVATSENYQKATAECKVIIKATDPILDVEKSNISMVYGDKNVRVKYTYNGDGRITISVSDTKVITASIDGNEIVISSKGKGTAKITITSASTGKFNEASTEINVEVVARPIELSWSQDEFVYDGTQKEITAIITNLVDNDEVILSYKENQKTVVGDYVAEVVALNNENYTLIGATNVSHNWKIVRAERHITVQDKIELIYGTSGEVAFTYNGEDVTSIVISQDINVATVEYEDEIRSGKIILTPVGAGETTITITVPASDNYEEATATFKVTVERAIPRIILPEQDVIMIYGDSIKEIKYEYTGNGNATITTSDENVATVELEDSRIRITPKKVGSTTITLKMEKTRQYEDVSASINLTVKPRPVELYWKTRAFAYNGKQHTITAQIMNVVTGDSISIVEYTGNTAIEMGTYTATVTKLSNDNYTLIGGINISTEWIIRELLPPQIEVKQGETIIPSGMWASGDVTIEVKELEEEDVDTEFAYEYSYNGKDWTLYTGVFNYTVETAETKIYARAYSKESGYTVSSSGDYTLRLDKTDPEIKIVTVTANNSKDNIITQNSEITVILELEDTTSGIISSDFTADDISIMITKNGTTKESQSALKKLVPDASNETKEKGIFGYTLTLSNISENGRVTLRIKEKGIYDRAKRYNRLSTLSLNLSSDNEGPELGTIKTNGDEYGRVFGNKVELSITASDSSGIESYEWQVSKDGKTWETFDKQQIADELSKAEYDQADDGVYSFRVIVKDIVGNISTSQTTKTNLSTSINRKPTIRFESEQISSTKVKIIAIIKSTKKITSVTVNATEVDSRIWKDSEAKTNNEWTITVPYEARDNGVYTWTVVDEAGNTVTEKFNVTTIDESQIKISYKTYDATEYSLAKIEFEGAQDIKIVRVITPDGVLTDVTSEKAVEGMTFGTIDYSRKIVVRFRGIEFEKGTIFVFENKSKTEREIEITEDIETRILYVRTVSVAINMFDKLFKDTFAVENAQVLVNHMPSKTKEVNGAIHPYYGISENSIRIKMTEQDEFYALGYLSESIKGGSALKMNQYGELEKLKASITQDSGTDITYTSGNITGVKNLERQGTLGGILNWTNGPWNTFRITLRAK